MLSARIQITQVLNHFQVGCEIVEFSPGTDPVFWRSTPLVFVLEDMDPEEDALSTTLTLLRLWSEKTTER